MDKLLDDIIKKVETGNDVVIVTILKAEGSSPRGAGAIMAVYPDGSSSGTVGGGAIEYRSQQIAAELFQQPRSFLQDFYLGVEREKSIGMICGGDVTLYFQYLAADQQQLDFLLQVKEKVVAQKRGWLVLQINLPDEQWSFGLMNSVGVIEAQSGPFQPADLADEELANRQPNLYQKTDCLRYLLPVGMAGTVYVFGGGHVAQKLVPLLSSVGFRTAVLDDRQEFVNEHTFPTANERICSSIRKSLENLTIEEHDYIVIMTRGHMFDRDILKWSLKTASHYVGLMGSQNKLNVTYTHLIQQEGFTYKDLKKVHAPIGMAIGDETPEEIAIGIAAELIAIRSGKLV